MPATYNEFSTVTQDGQEYIIAQPKSDHDEPVRFSGKLSDTDDMDAPYRDVIQALIKEDLSSTLNLEAGEGGKIKRDDVIDTLEDVDEGPVAIHSREQAEAIVDYFLDEGILAEDGTEVTILSDPATLAELAASEEQSDTDTKMLLNWMSAIDSCIAKIDDTIETVEGVEKELQEKIGEINVSEKKEEYQQKQEEVAQQIMNLTNGGDLEESDLGPQERAEYQRLEHRLFHLDAMIESIDDTGDLDREINKMTKELGMRINNLQDTKSSLEVQKKRLQQVYKFNNEIDYQKASEMAKFLSQIASKVAGVATAEERGENEDATEYAAEILGQTEQVVEQESPDIDEEPTEFEQT